MIAAAPVLPYNGGMEKQSKKPNSMAVRVVVLLVVVAAVLGVFFLKKSSGEAAVVSTPAAGSGEELPFEVTSVDMDSILSYGLPVMIDFGAEECGPCQYMKPDLEQIYEESRGAAVVHYIDVWVNTQAAADYPVTVVPTQMFVLPDGTPWQPPEGFAEEIGVQFTGQPQHTMHEGILSAEQMRAILIEMGAAL